jgi:NADH-quinone oxidoreductase subunit C/D
MLGIGILTKEQALSYAVTGPSGRASGFSCDIRKHAPYAVYDKVQFEEVIRHEGDVFARYMNRLDEITQSLHILEQLVDNIPEGDYFVKPKGIIRLPEGEYYQMVEAARGILGVYICSKGDKNPYRLKFRSPGLSLVSIVDPISRQQKIADLIAIGGSLDYVVPDIDR